MSYDTLRIGVDEAGLGPTLGPLMIGAFATSGPEDFFGALGDVVGPPGSKGGCIEIGDSKKIHSGTRKLARLERSVLTCWMWAFDRDAPPATARELLDSVRAHEGGRVPDLRAPWYLDLDEPLPIANELSELVDLAGRLRHRAALEGLEPLAYRADLISAAAMNAELAEEAEAGGSKNTWVVQRTLAMVEELTAQSELPRARVVCDKAGGRDSYLAPLERAFPAHVVEVLEQARECGRYRLDGLLAPGPAMELSFRMKADDLEPRVSVAACLAKYLREISMRAFNRYFAAGALASGAEAPRPTAGYPQDAKRFIEEMGWLAQSHDLPASRWIRGR